MMGDSFSSHLREEADSIWEAIFAHPFLREVGLGTLPREKFKFFVCQDYHYLFDFARVLCLCGAKAEDLTVLELFIQHA